MKRDSSHLDSTRGRFWRALASAALALVSASAASVNTAAASAASVEGATEAPEYLEIRHAPGRPGGRLVAALRAEPTTFNPVLASDVPSRTVVRRLMADLVHTHRESQQSEPALARSWTVSPDGKRFTLELRRGISFSDGHPFDADDVIFTFQVYLDKEVGSGYLPLLTIGGEPIRVRKLGSHRLEFELAQPYAVGVKIFDSIPILPRHKLEKAYRAGTFREVWGLASPVEEIVGLGPYRLKSYLPGERLVLARNPHYWKVDRTGHRLPYLDELVVVFVPAQDTQVARFRKGEIDVIDRLSAESFHLLEQTKARGEYDLDDLGPGFAFHFLFFNLNDVDPKSRGELAGKQTWFRQAAFRRAVSRAIDRSGIVRVVYRQRAAPLVSHVPPGNERWFNEELRAPGRSVSEARRLLQEAGFTWDGEGGLRDAGGRRVRFTLLTNSSSSERVQMLPIIRRDLGEIGIEVRPLAIEYTALIDRITRTYEYDAAILALTGGMDPNEVINVWSTEGTGRLWRLNRQSAEEPWQIEVDQLMHEQVTLIDAAARKAHYDRVQRLLADHEPCILLVSPNVLVGADRRLSHFAPTIVEHVTLWNVDELYWNDSVARDR